MADSKKTREDLVRELETLRSRCRDLENRPDRESRPGSDDSAFRELVDNAGEGFLLVDHSGRLLYANREAANISGYSKEQLLQRRLHDLVPPDELPAVLERLTRRITGKDLPQRYESVLLHRDGSQIPLEVSGTSVLWRGDRVSMTMIRDITKRKKAEEELGRIAEEKSVLFREVNHRVKNNLAAIIGVLLKEQRSAEEEGNTAYLPVLRSLVGRVMGLATVHGMLSAVEWRPLRITDICAQVTSAAVQSVSDSNQIRVRITPSPLLVSNEQAQHLALVINELTANSIKHALGRQDGIQIKISIAGSGSKIRLVYQDDGPGYPEALVAGDFSAANVGFDLVLGIVVKSLRGELTLSNDSGAMASIIFEREVDPGGPGEHPQY